MSERETLARLLCDTDQPAGNPCQVPRQCSCARRYLRMADAVVDADWRPPQLEPQDPATAPGMTDLMVPPETLGAFMAANPLPPEPQADHRWPGGFPPQPQAVPVPAEVLERARLAAEAIVKTWTKEGPVQLNQLWLEKEIAGYILASDAARVAAERERDALRHHYDAANVAAGRSPASSRPLSCYIEDLRSRAEAAEQRLQQVEAALAIDAKSSSGQMEDER